MCSHLLTLIPPLIPSHISSTLWHVKYRSQPTRLVSVSGTRVMSKPRTKQVQGDTVLYISTKPCKLWNLPSSPLASLFWWTSLWLVVKVRNDEVSVQKPRLPSSYCNHTYEHCMHVACLLLFKVGCELYCRLYINCFWELLYIMCIYKLVCGVYINDSSVLTSCLYT